MQKMISLKIASFEKNGKYCLSLLFYYLYYLTNHYYFYKKLHDFCIIRVKCLLFKDHSINVGFHLYRPIV